MLARVKSGALLGVDAYIVEVEVDLAPGLPAFTIVTQWERNSFFLSFRW
jgi:magnesium chelatase family protein